MPPKKPSRSPRKRPTGTPSTRLEVSYEERPDFKGEVTAFVFDNRGNLLAQAPVKVGKATLPLSDKDLRRVRLFLAPTLPDERPPVEPTLQSMQRLRAYEPAISFDPDGGLDVLRVPGDLLDHWIWCLCRVRGRVVRPVQTDGTTEDRAVCNARVHICEVDKIPRLIVQLPDDRIFRLRDDLLRLIERWPPIRIPRPLPDPPPFVLPIPLPDPALRKLPSFAVDPAVRDFSPQALAKMQSFPQFEDTGATAGASFTPSSTRKGFNPQPEPPGPRGAGALGPQPEPPDVAAAAGQPALRALRASVEAAGFRAISADVRIALESSSATAVRDALLANPGLVLQALCLWPWWWWYTCDEIAVVETDHFGRFDTWIAYRCAGDKPDLYFWVEYLIDGAWQTVYRPPIPCYTHWDYVCGTEVTIRVHDPRVPACDGVPDLPGCQVAIMSIGNQVSVSEIQGAGAAPADEGLTNDGRPFGGRLEPHVWFSRSALFAKGITHYRWSYRRLTQPDGVTPMVGGWNVMDRRVGRHYSVIDPVTSDLSFPFEQLGPDPAAPAANLFRIQPLDPPAPGIDWEVRDAREDTASAFFMTHTLEGGNAGLAAGKYEVKLELFKVTGGVATVVDWDAEGVLMKVSDQPAPIGQNTDTTVTATSYYRIKSGGNTVAFRMVLRVDNNKCFAQIHTILGSGLSTDPNCGYIEYQPNALATISFQAMHPNDFGRLNFDIRRGLSVDVPDASVHGPLKPTSLDTDAGPPYTAPAGPFTRNAIGVYTTTVPVDTLLTSNTPSGTTPCARAAFAETLYVHATATDGWGDLDYLDSGLRSAAFALDTPCPPCN